MKRLMAMVAVSVLVASTAPIAHAAAPTAELIDVHRIRPAKAKPGGGAANCSNDNGGAYTGSFVATGWTVQGPTTAHLNTSTVPGVLGNVSDDMQAGFNAWTGVPNINVATDGTATRQSANRADEIMFGRTSAIAVTYTWLWNDGFVESDIVFSNRLGWFTASSEGDGCDEGAGAKYDVANIATHEIGHLYGLGHPSGARYETMYAYGFTGETLKRSPTPGEKSGLASLY